MTLAGAAAGAPSGRQSSSRTRPAAVPACQPLVFEGEVRRGSRFEHPFGHGLIFVLEPVAQGWAIRIWSGSGAHGGPDLAELGTPPYRSVSPLLLTTDFGFRAQDVIAWTPRNFRYVVRSADRPGAERAYKEVVATAHASPAQEAAVLRTVEASAEGQLTILDADLVPGAADSSRAAAAVATRLENTPHTMLPGSPSPQGRVERLRFRVSLAIEPRGPGLCREPGH